MENFPEHDRKRTRRSAAERDEIVSRVTRVAGTRGGATTGADLVERGLGRKEIAGYVRTGWLHDLEGDVYAVGHEALTKQGWLYAALLSGGPNAALSYWTAAVLWRLLDRAPNANEIHVSTQRSDREGCRGAVIHAPRKLPENDCTTINSLRVTTLFRTLLDLATVASPAQLLGLVEAAHTVHGIDLLTLAAYARSFRRRPGAARLREAAYSVAGPVRLRSNLERMFRELAREWGLPEYETNVPFEGQELDVFFRDRNAAIELDWFDYHGGRSSYRRDHRKARKLARVGVALLPVAGEDLEEHRDDVRVDVLAYLANHPPVTQPAIPANPIGPSSG